MRSRPRWQPACLAVALLAASGCTYDLSFSNRPSHAAVQAAEDLAVSSKGPIAVRWNPASFPDRVDVQGPSSNEGAATQAKIPTGVALASRLEELLDVAVGVERSSSRVLGIRVIEARSEYEYAIGVVSARRIDTARCVFEAEFTAGDRRHRERFTAEAREGQAGTATGTVLLDHAWDEVALQATSRILELELLSGSFPTAAVSTPRRARPRSVAPPVVAPVVTPAPGGTDLDLQSIIDAWPTLSEPVKQRILGIVEGATAPR